MRAGQRNDSDPTGWPQWKPAPWLNWIEGGTRTQKLAIRFHWFNQPDDPPGARPDRPNNSHRPDNIAIQTECWNQSNASANWITAKFHAPTNLENKQSSGFEQSIQSFPNTHTHTHTHTRRERESGGEKIDASFSCWIQFRSWGRVRWRLEAITLKRVCSLQIEGVQLVDDRYR